MSKLFKQLLDKRGLDEGFLLPKYEELTGVDELPNIEQAAKRIIQAAEQGEKVLIYGDYDADGVTASVVMHDALKLAGVEQIEIMLPNRFEDGYGMSEKVVEKAVQDGVGLVVTVDCGSGNREIVAQLKAKGVEVIITDHHECPKELPKAVAVVNPKRQETGKWRDLAGVGVAFMVAYKLMQLGKIPEGQEKWLLDMVAVGTICDNMRLTGENRRLVYWGMKVLAKTRRVGLRELIKKAGVKRLNSYAVGFIIGPRLNAAGRMQSAELALKLLMTKSGAEAAALAEQLEKLNAERREEQGRALKEIKQQGAGNEPVLVTIGDWHEGVLGIIAGNLTEDYKRPSFVLTEVDGIYKGSGRSFGEFNLAEALKACEATIIGGGGHAGACGVKVEKDKLEEFTGAVNDYYRSLGLREQERFLQTEADLAVRDLAEVDMELMEELARLEPFGEGNQEPVWLLKNMLAMEVRRLGAEEQHLKVIVGDSKERLALIYFNAPKQWLELEKGQRYDFTVRLTVNEWNGVSSVEGVVEKIGVEELAEF